MRRQELQRRSYRRYLRAALSAAMLTTLACGGDINFSPVAPEWPPQWQETGAGDRLLEITGSLTSAEGEALEATILYDGVEVPGARNVCRWPKGCTQLKLQGDVRSDTGRHTISLQVLRQESGLVAYTAQGTVVVSRESLIPSMGQEWLVSIPLESTEAQLGEGESVDYEIQFED